MIEKIERINENGQERLNVSINGKEEFACGFSRKLIGKTFEEEMDDFLSRENIDWKKKPISLLVDGRLLGTIDWKKEK